MNNTIMQKVKLDKIDLLERLHLLDDDLSYLLNGKKIQLNIVGGAALILGGFRNRTTEDIDVCNPFSKELIDIFNKYDFNTRVLAYCDSFPYNYEDRLVKIDENFKCIDVYRISLEDLVISKLRTNRLKDAEDIRTKTIVGMIDWELLKKLAKEECYFFTRFDENAFVDRLNAYLKEYNK